MSLTRQKWLRHITATCIKNAKFKMIKIRTGCQCVGYFYYSKRLNWTAQILLNPFSPACATFLQFFKSLQRHDSPANWAREQFKPSANSASLQLQVKKYFSFWVLGFLKVSSHWGHVFAFLANFPGSGHQPSEPYFWLKFFLWKLGQNPRL